MYLARMHTRSKLDDRRVLLKAVRHRTVLGTQRTGRLSSAQVRQNGEPDTMTTHGPFDLHGLSALVTGAGRGLGAAIAQGLAAAGATTYIISRNRAELNAVAQGITDRGGQAVPMVCDITDAKAVQDAMDAIERLDILVN